MRYHAYWTYYKTREAFYYLLPMSYLRRKQSKLSGLERSMLRHPAKVSADTYDRVADHVSSINRVIHYAENNKWTADEIKDIVIGFSYVGLFFLAVALLGGLLGE